MLFGNKRFIVNVHLFCDRWLLESLRDALCLDGDDNQLDISTYRGLLISWFQRHTTDVSLSWHNPKLGQCDEANVTVASETGLSYCDTNPPVSSVTPVRGPPFAHTSQTPVQMPTPIQPSPLNRTQDSFAWCGAGDTSGHGLGDTPWPRPSVNENRFRRCLEGHFAASNR